MNRIPLLILTVLLAGCAPEPRPIEYGADQCDFCRMTIVDRQHGAEVVTAKGRVYKFDAIECMVNYVRQEGEEQFALFLVNDYLAPGKLIDARTAVFLISPAIPSPMGAFLSAFAGEDAAARVSGEKGGERYDWEAMKEKLEQ